jgi:hypothetical protein
MFSQKIEAPEISTSVYVDAYYATDNDNSTGWGQNRKYSFVNYRKDVFGLNAANFTLSAKATNYRGKLTLQAGDIKKSAWDGVTDNPSLYEGNFGIRLFEGFWIDAGYYITHIGAEAVLPIDNWMSIHNCVGYFEPFYSSGIKASYDINENWHAELHLVNGNGIIEDNNSNKSVGYYLSYTDSKFFASYSGIAGNEESSADDSKLATYSNFLFQYTFSDKFAMKAQFDFATRADVPDPVTEDVQQATYMGTAVQAQWKFVDNFAFAARFAYADNTKEARLMPDGLYKGMGITANLTYFPTTNSFIRLEGRMLQFDDDDTPQSNNKPFIDTDGNPTNSRMEIMLNYGLRFDAIF